MRSLVIIFVGFIGMISCSGVTKDTGIIDEPTVENQVAQDTQDAMGEDAQVQRMDEALNITLDDIIFNFNKVSLKPQGKRVIHKLVQVMQKYPTTVVHITGHSDNIGSRKAKANIAKGRARTVAKFLKSEGISSKRITYTGVSDRDPRLPNTSKINRRKNRRVELRLEVKRDQNNKKPVLDTMIS